MLYKLKTQTHSGTIPFMICAMISTITARREGKVQPDHGRFFPVLPSLCGAEQVRPDCDVADPPGGGRPDTPIATHPACHCFVPERAIFESYRAARRRRLFAEHRAGLMVLGP